MREIPWSEPPYTLGLSVVEATRQRVLYRARMAIRWRKPENREQDREAGRLPADWHDWTTCPGVDGYQSYGCMCDHLPTRGQSYLRRRYPTRLTRREVLDLVFERKKAAKGTAGAPEEIETTTHQRACKYYQRLMLHVIRHQDEARQVKRVDTSPQAPLYVEHDQHTPVTVIDIRLPQGLGVGNIQRAQVDGNAVWRQRARLGYRSTSRPSGQAKPIPGAAIERIATRTRRVGRRVPALRGSSSRSRGLAQGAHQG